MYILKYFILFVLLLAMMASPLVAQEQVSGIVVESSESGKNPRPITGANVYWAESGGGTVSDSKGEFSLPLPEALPAQLIVSFVGFQRDTLEVSGPTDKIRLAL